MSLPQVASRADWLAARKELLIKEKELTRARDALNTQRRLLPMVEVTKDYVFASSTGKQSLRDLFGEQRQLIVGHVMFDPAWDEGCPSCSAGLDELSDGMFRHLAVRETAFVHVSRAPIDKIDRYKAKKGWNFSWVSSHGSDFNYDFHVSLDAAIAPVEYNFAPADEPGEPGEAPGVSCFLRDGDRVFHTYSVYARGLESTGGSYYFLDLTALGRQEDWELPSGRVEAARGAVPDFAE